MPISVALGNRNYFQMIVGLWEDNVVNIPHFIQLLIKRGN